MIKALLLIFFPVRAWERVFRARRSPWFILAVFLIPLLVLSSAGEAYGLVHWGKWQNAMVREPKTFARGEAALFEALQFLLTLGVVLINAGLLKSTGGTFHTRHTFAEAFTAIAYGLSPLFLCRLLNASSDVPPWLSWAVGVVLSMMVLYHGVPKIMQPDPAHAFGLYVITSLLVLFTTGLLQLITACYLMGKFPKLTTFIASLAGRLPF
jgi:hypothetical protein